MNDQGAGDSEKNGLADGGPQEAGARDGFQSNRARQLFGHKGGASPWEQAADATSGPREDPPTTSSAPYPQEASYAPREVAVGGPAPDSIFSDVDDDGELTKLHPNYKLMMRVGAAILAFVVVFASLAADGAVSTETDFPFGIITGVGVLIALFLVIRVPTARYNARGYQISRDRLRVVRGILWHSDTIVPFGRVQHIDVDQGPIERALSIATMTLHTAGSHNASVRLPGLGHELAVQMREEIRAHIKRESM